MESINCVCHITTIHPRYDIRIFHKECLSLSLSYQVILLVADGKGNEEAQGVRILDIGIYKKLRLKRMFVTSYQLYKKALSLDCDFFHFHDPDFLFFGYLLAKKGKKVIYDAHEDLPRQIMGKYYIAPLFRRLISGISEIIEDHFSKNFGAIVSATPAIKDRFIKLNTNVIVVCNYPHRDEFALTKEWIEKKNKICYIGGISKVRGIKELLDSLKYIKFEFELDLVGDIEGEKITESIESEKTRHKINFPGIVDRIRVKEILYESKVGIVALHPVPNHLTSLPVKMFEYMAAGIPVVASDFPLWKQIIEENQCGICVDPLNPNQIAEAINYLFENPEIAQSMGKNGREAIKKKYKWESEARKLIVLYNSLT